MSGEGSRHRVSEGTSARQFWRALIWCVTGWLFLSLVYAALLYAQSLGAMGPAVSMRVAVENTFAPAVMGAGVWWFTGRYPLPASRLLPFLAVHASLAVGFAVLWTAWMLFIAGGGRTPRELMVHSALPWHAVMGLLLYGLIAGSSYAARGALRSRDFRLAAERAERLRAEAELAALRAHINPHFLFNTLHSVSELLRAEPAAAEQAIERLSDLFRYTLRLDRHHLALVPLEDEWKFTNSYLWLERLRMGPRLHVDADIDDEALGCLIPPFVLQPLVENAIRHGLGPAPAGGTLELRAHEEEGRLTLRIRDDGVGADVAALAESSGLGLRSVRQRLAACYGAQASVDVAGELGAGMVVTVILPAELAS